jgi:hypothetical protein
MNNHVSAMRPHRSALRQMRRNRHGELPLERKLNDCPGERRHGITPLPTDD